MDGVVTDPPYGIGFDRATWDDKDIVAYGEMMRWLSSESIRLVGEGPVFIWQALLNLTRWCDWFPEGFRVLACCKGFVQYRPTPIQWSWDPIVFWGKPHGDNAVGKRDWYVQLLAPFGANRPKIKHPCPRPMESVKYVISLTASETILDPFMGSGTTLRAAKDLGRRAIGIEIEEKYCEIAANRLRQDVLF